MQPSAPTVPPTSAHVAVSTAAILGLVTLALSATPASAAPSGLHRLGPVRGTFIGAPFVITNVQPTHDASVMTFDASGGDRWAGDLDGSTTYHGRGEVDITSGDVTMLLHETFVGTIAGVGSGELDLFDVVKSGPGNLGTVTCLTTAGRGAFHNVHGALVFAATSVVDPDPSGNGTSYGDYHGLLTR